MTKIRNSRFGRELTSLFFLILLFAVVGLFNPIFISPKNISACFNTSVVYTLVAIGMAFTIFIGEIDVSVGSTLGFVATVVGSMLRDGQNWTVAFIVGIAIGAAIGLFNGWGISVMKIPSLIFTLGTNGILRGLMYIYNNGAWVENLPKDFKDFSSVTLIGDITIYYACVIILMILIHLYLEGTEKGKYFKAVGDNADAATLVGIPVKRTKVISYLICGILSAVAGIIFCSRIGFVTPSSGAGYEMEAVAACVLGGISLAGGTGTVIGASIGAVIMASISYLLVFMGFSSNFDNAITGIILIAIVVSDSILHKRLLENNRRLRLAARTQDKKDNTGEEKGEGHEE